MTALEQEAESRVGGCMERRELKLDQNKHLDRPPSPHLCLSTNLQDIHPEKRSL